MDRSDSERQLVEAGARRVVAIEGAAQRELARAVLEESGMAPHLISMLVAGVEPDGEGLRLSAEQRASEQCDHAEETSTVFPGSERACPECVAEGHGWVHLRVCMTCGFVGCCDSSEGRHARKHFEDTGHPIIMSWEPGEGWAFCHVHQTNV